MGTRYRVWIVRYRGDRPNAWRDVPLGATAVEPAERGTMSARQARQYVETFNRAAARGPQKICCVAVPVSLRYVGDPQPGEALAAARCETDSAHEKSPLLACQVSAGNGLPPREST